MKYLIAITAGGILGVMLMQGAMYQVEVETVANGHIAYSICAPQMPVFDGEKWECGV